MNYYERHIGDYIRDTVGLTMLQEGAYTRLLDQIYQTELPLSGDRKQAYRTARAASAAERKAVDHVLDTFFTLTEAGYAQKRAMREIVRVQEKMERGKRNADSRWGKQRVQALLDPKSVCKTDANGDANAMQNACNTPCKNDAHQTPSTNHQAPDTTPTPFPSPENSGSHAPAEPDRVGCSALAISKILCEAGVPAAPADPRIRKLAEDGLALSTIAAACEQAKRSRPNEAIGLPYVLGVLKRWSAEAKSLDIAVPSLPGAKAETKSADVWWTSNAGIERKGRELRMYAHGTESYTEFKDRIFAEIEKRKVRS